MQKCSNTERGPGQNLGRQAHQHIRGKHLPLPPRLNLAHLPLPPLSRARWGWGPSSPQTRPETVVSPDDGDEDTDKPRLGRGLACSV